jgi:hypothetical protein
MIVRGEIKIPPGKRDKHLKALFDGVFCIEPNMRPTIEDILFNKFFLQNSTFVKYWD